MRGPSVRPIVIAAGGTGGHFFPAEALAAELQKRGHRVALMTDARSGALVSEIFGACERHVLRGAGIAGRGTLRAATAALSLAAGTMQARSILGRLEAAALVGFGGYPSVAPVLSTRLLRQPPRVLLHEQNAVLGRANRMLSRYADTLALSFAATERVPTGAHTDVTGNPVRPGIIAVAGAPYAAPGDEVRLLVLGGSLGARVFSDVVPTALAALPESLRARLRVTQQCRQEDLARVRAAYAEHKILRVFWTGVKYTLRDNLDIAGAYYHYYQNDYNTSPCTDGGLSASSCRGTLNAFSAMVSYRPAKRVEAYGGFLWSQVTGGLASGYLYRVNFAPTIGMRVDF